MDGKLSPRDFENNLKKGSYKIGITLLEFTYYEKEFTIENDTIDVKKLLKNIGMEVTIQNQDKTMQDLMDSFQTTSRFNDKLNSTRDSYNYA